MGSIHMEGGMDESVKVHVAPDHHHRPPRSRLMAGPPSTLTSGARAKNVTRPHSPGCGDSRPSSSHSSSSENNNNNHDDDDGDLHHREQSGNGKGDEGNDSDSNSADNEEARGLLVATTSSGQLSPMTPAMATPSHSRVLGGWPWSMSSAIESSGQSSPAYSQYTTPIRHPLDERPPRPTVSPPRATGASTLNAMTLNRSQDLVDEMDVGLETKSLAATAAGSPEVDRGIRIATSTLASLNSSSPFPKTSFDSGAPLCGRNPKKNALVIVILLLVWGTFIFGCHIQKRMIGLENQVISLTNAIQTLQIQRIQKEAEFSRQIMQLTQQRYDPKAVPSRKLKTGEFSSAKTLPIFPPAIDLDRKMVSTTSSQRLIPQNATSKPTGTTVKDSLFGNLFGNELFSETPHEVLHRTEPCSTENDAPCVFPFKYEGKNQSRCLKSLLPGKTWCAIKLQSDGTFIQQQDTWDYCQKDCA